MTRRTDTAVMEVKTADSFCAWQELLGNRFGRIAISTTVPHFSGRIRSTSIDGANLTEIRAEAHQVSRTENLIVTTDKHHLKLSLLLSGSGVVAQDGRSATLHTGDAAIYDTSRPYTFNFSEPVRALIMVFPYEFIDVPQRILKKVTAVRLDGTTGIGRLVVPFMEHIAAELDQLEGASGRRILRSAINLLGVLITTGIEESATEQAGMHYARLEEYKLYIERHLDDPDLSSESIASAHYVSTRSVQYAFQEFGETVSAYIRARRLERCRLDLADSGLQDLSIQQIASRWGVQDSAHFSRIFKSAFGVSPSVYRHDMREEALRSERAPLEH